MTTETMRFKKGDKVDARVDVGFMVLVEILDSRVSYGNKHYLVSPVAGHGQRWVSAERFACTY